MGPPRVSILVPCYQQAQYLPAAVDSALAQTTLSEVEVLIVNDGSTDATGAVARRYVTCNPERVKLVEQPNRGLAMARAAALEVARGQFLVFLDADDVLEADAVAICLEAFARHPEADLVVGNAWSVSEDGRIVRPFDQAQVPRWPQILEFNPFGAVMAVMARTNGVRRAGGLAVDGLRACEDWDLWIRMIRCHMRVVPVQARLGRHRERPQSLGRDPLIMVDSKITVLDSCARDDPRLARSPVPPAPPITRAEYSRFRNAAVFHGLGLALALGRAERVDDVLTRLVPSKLDPEYCARQFVWGWQHGREGVGDTGSAPPIPAARVDAALQRAGLGRFRRSVRRHLSHAVRPRHDLIWLWRGVRWRLRRLVHATTNVLGLLPDGS